MTTIAELVAVLTTQFHAVPNHILISCVSCALEDMSTMDPVHTYVPRHNYPDPHAACTLEGTDKHFEDWLGAYAMACRTIRPALPPAGIEG